MCVAFIADDCHHFGILEKIGKKKDWSGESGFQRKETKFPYHVPKVPYMQFLRL